MINPFTSTPIDKLTQQTYAEVQKSLLEAQLALFAQQARVDCLLNQCAYLQEQLNNDKQTT